MKIRINKSRAIGDQEPCFIIAEIGSNHNGDIDKAKKLINIAAKARVDAVKFQSIIFEELYINNKKNSDIRKLYKKIEFNENWYPELNTYCIKKGLFFLSCPTYLKSIDLLEKIDVDLYKLASPQVATYPQLIQKVAKLKKPTILSTGYCTFTEIDRAVDIFIKEKNKKFALLHCISEYPTLPEHVNLFLISAFKQRYNVPIGFSDHTLGYDISIAAVARGANILEKHITLSRDLEGPDHYFSLEPSEFVQMVKAIRNVERSFGNGEKKHLLKKEIAFLDNVRMKAIAGRNIKKGKIIDKEKDIFFLRNVNGIDAWALFGPERFFSKKDIRKGISITWKNSRKEGNG